MAASHWAVVEFKREHDKVKLVFRSIVQDIEAAYKYEIIICLYPMLVAIVMHLITATIIQINATYYYYRYTSMQTLIV